MMARILVLDLNPKLSYPDLSIAYLVTPLRAAGFQVEVQALTAHKSNHPLASQALKDSISPPELSLIHIQNYLESTQPALILIPNYLNHYASVQFLAKRAQELQLPLILGGACLNTCNHEDLPLWLNLPGVTAVFVGQADWVIVELVETTLNKQALAMWPGIYQQGESFDSMTAPPLQELEHLPIPDLSDFAWKRYTSALIPVLTGRSATLENKQSVYRTRPVQAVLDELQIQTERYQRKTFIFLDSRLNINLAMWHGLIDNIQQVVPDCQWIATIYLDGQNGLGLDLNTLVAARTAGLRHLTISIEAAQALKYGKLFNAAMERNREFVACAYQAGLSVRCLVNSNNSFKNLADLPNTNDFALRKLVETEQAKQQLNREDTKNTVERVQINSNSKPELKTTQSQTIIKHAHKKKTSKQPTKSFWQHFKSPFLINKTNKRTKVNQLV